MRNLITALLLAVLTIGVAISIWILLTDQPPELTEPAVRVGLNGEPTTLDPHKYFTNVEEQVLKDLFIGLTTMDADGNVVPGVAERWEMSDFGLSWKFYLRPDVTWSDGQPLTAHDFVYSFRRLLNPETAAPLAFFVYSIRNAEAVNHGHRDVSELGVHAEDDYTLRIELTLPMPYLPERLLYPIAYPVPQHAIEEHDDDWVRAENWVSNGAYLLSWWRPRASVRLRKNPAFFDAGNVAINNVHYYPITDPNTGYNRYRAGELETISDYPRNLIEKLKAESPTEVQNSPLQSIMYVVFNTQQPPFNRQDARRALTAALDKQALMDGVLRHGEIRSDTLAPPIVREDWAPEFTANYDPELARDLLLSIGHGPDNPLEFTLNYIAGDENKTTFVAIASMWQKIGVNVTLHHSDLGAHFGALQAGDFQAAQAGWFGESHPEHYVELLYSRIGPTNYGAFRSIAFDRAYESARSIAEAPRRYLHVLEAESQVLREYPVIPLYSVMTRNLVKPTVGGWRPNGRNLHPARYFYWN